MLVLGIVDGTLLGLSEEEEEQLSLNFIHSSKGEGVPLGF